MTQEGPPVFVPPASVSLPASTTTPPPVAEAPRLTPTPSCTDNLAYEEDLSIPDGSHVAPGDRLDKRWKIKNSGTCNWDESYRLKIIAGPEMGAPTEQALYPARSGVEVLVRIVFTAPSDPGSYRSAWQAYSSTGEAFGDPIFIDVVVP